MGVSASQKRQSGILQRNLDIGPEVAERVASIVMQTFEKVTEERTFVAQEIECVGELHLTSRIWWHLSDKFPDDRFEDIAAENAEPRGGTGSRRLFNKRSDADWTGGGRIDIRIDTENTMAFNIAEFDFTDGNNASTMPLARTEQLAGHWDSTEHDYVRKKNSKSFLS